MCRVCLDLDFVDCLDFYGLVPSRSSTDVWQVAVGLFDLVTKGFIILGGVWSFMFQYIEIYKREDASGFSMPVCLTLYVASILRILFWFGKRFEWPLLAQSMVVLIAMTILMEISIRMNRKNTPETERVSVFTGHLISHFWAWHDRKSFAIVLAVFTLFCSILTYFLIRNTVYIELLGTVALISESSLCFPQIWRNCLRFSTEGMSTTMTILWLFGDILKTIYFVINNVPAQFWICGTVQTLTDIMILLQVFVFSFFPKERINRRNGANVNDNGNVELLGIRQTE